MAQELQTSFSIFYGPELVISSQITVIRLENEIFQSVHKEKMGWVSIGRSLPTQHTKIKWGHYYLRFFVKMSYQLERRNRPSRFPDDSTRG